MTRFQARHKTTIIALGAVTAALALLFVLWTPLCLWTTGSVSDCRRMTCELIAMRRPHGDHGWCEAWFERFREDPPPAETGAPSPPVD